jgi:hypothetical protein
MSQQYGFGFDAPEGFNFGGQAGFDFSTPESAHSREERERRRRNEEESAARRKREREQRQREESANRERQRQQDESRSRARHSAPWESAWDVLGVPYTATKAQIRKAWAAKMKACHPDLGGNVADAQRFNRAYEELKGGRR